MMGVKVDQKRATEYHAAWTADRGKLAKRLGFELVELGRRFSYDGALWDIAGIYPKAGRFRIVCRQVTSGELRRFSKTLVRACAPEYRSTR